MLKDKVIIVTGASKGIGKDIAKALASEGAHLALIARGEPNLLATAIDIRREHRKIKLETYSCDMSQASAVEETIKKIISDFGRLDGCISNAGYAHPQYFDQTPTEEFEKQMATNYMGAVYLVKACRPHLKSGSFIAMTASMLGYMGCFGYSSYSPTKFAIMGLAESLRQELSFDGIQVSVLCPPDTLTPGFDIENRTKPRETRALSEGMRTISSQVVATTFVLGLKKGKFLINCSLESELIYRLKHMLPEVYHKILMMQLKRIRKIAI